MDCDKDLLGETQHLENDKDDKNIDDTNVEENNEVDEDIITDLDKALLAAAVV